MLGIGIRWLSLGLTGYEEDGCPYDLDTAASREYQDISGCTGQSVPVETDFGRGTRCKHWDEACMLGEVMTGKLSNTTAEDLKLSRMTIGTLEDIGYEVDYEAADDYTAADMNETCVCNGQGRRLVKDKTTQRRRQLSEAGRRQAEAYGQSVLQSRKGKRERYQFSMSQARYVGHESIRVFFVEDEEIFAVDVLAASG